jgi:hypothetical protein
VHRRLCFLLSLSAIPQLGKLAKFEMGGSAGKASSRISMHMDAEINLQVDI